MSAAARKVIVLGIDGLDPRILERLMDGGQAPAFARLRALGAYRRLATTTPPQSPVAWSTIATGSNPGRHGVYDFVRRDPRRYRPELSILRPNPRNLLGRRRAMFLPVRGATPFWSVTSEAGIPTTVVRWPLTLPPEPVSGAMLAGLGVPDLKANLGRYTLYTTRDAPPSEARRLKGDVVRLPAAAATMHTSVTGPERASVPMELRVDREARRVTVRLADQEHELDEGRWSGPVRIAFTVHVVRTVRGLCWFHLASVTPHVELYLSPIQADPRDPAFILSHPDAYAAELAEAIGDYHTLGMPEDTNALRDGCFDADAFLDLCDTVMAEREAMLWHELDRLSEGLLAFVFDTTDRVQHVFWPPGDGERGRVIDDIYRRVDRVLGRLLDAIDAATALLVLSDHGFTAFRRAVHLNAWLVQNGFMSVDAAPRAEEQALLRSVDWRRTQAYAVGFTSIYLNLRGRERDGIVAPDDEADELKRRIAETLCELRDPSTGQQVVERAYDAASLYDGPFLAEAPDLVVGYRPGYRASWRTAIGGNAETTIEDNRESWSGDHLVEPSRVPGILFINRRTDAPQARARDIAPTVLHLLRLPPPGDTDGRSLLPD